MDLEQFHLESYQRVLMVAPHPDDETLGNGGLMQRALAAAEDRISHGHCRAGPYTLLFAGIMGASAVVCAGDM